MNWITGKGGEENGCPEAGIPLTIGSGSGAGGGGAESENGSEPPTRKQSLYMKNASRVNKAGQGTR